MKLVLKWIYFYSKYYGLQVNKVSSLIFKMF